MATTDITDRIADLLTKPMEGLGLDLEAVDLSRAGKRSVLRIAVDKDDGIDMDDIADATRTVSEVLDQSDVMGTQPYTLEVSSRGVDRPLTLPRHWRRNVDRLVQITRTDEDPITGRIRSADEERATIDVDGTVQQIEYAAVKKASIQIEFKPGPAKQED